MCIITREGVCAETQAISLQRTPTPTVLVMQFQSQEPWLTQGNRKRICVVDRARCLTYDAATVRSDARLASLANVLRRGISEVRLRSDNQVCWCSIVGVVEQQMRSLERGKILRCAIRERNCGIERLLGRIVVPRHPVNAESVTRDQNRHGLIWIHGPPISVVVSMSQEVPVSACVEIEIRIFVSQVRRAFAAP